MTYVNSKTGGIKKKDSAEKNTPQFPVMRFNTNN